MMTILIAWPRYRKIMNMYISQQHLHVTKQNMSNLSSAFDKLSSVSLSTRTHVQHESYFSEFLQKI